jgi:hypothetical protein
MGYLESHAPGASAAIIGALVEVLLGWFVLSFVIGRYFGRKADLSAHVERICDGLDKLSKDCAKYWLARLPGELTDRDKVLLEAKIKTGVLMAYSSIRLIEKKYSIKEEARVLGRVSGLQTACTAGQFEAAKREPDRSRYMKILRLIHEIQSGLWNLKL